MVWLGRRLASPLDLIVMALFASEIFTRDSGTQKDYNRNLTSCQQPHYCPENKILLYV